MPSLMPGMPGTKEAFAISIIHDNLQIRIPPKAFAHYKLENNGLVVLITGHRGKGGFGLVNMQGIEKTVFHKTVEQIEKQESVYWFKEKAYVVTKLQEDKVCMTPEMLAAFHLTAGTGLVVVKSTTVTMSYTPVEIWKANFEKHGFTEAIKNMEKLERL